MRDRDGGPLLTCIVKGTFVLADVPQIAPPDQQIPLKLAGEYYGKPDTSSLKYEPETAYLKRTTDIVLIGHATPTSDGKKSLDVGLTVGTVAKAVRVFGDRHWMRRMGLISMSSTATIDKPIPLIYERAFGGWDSADPDPQTSRFHAANPMGVGFPQTDFVEGQALPNIEDPSNLIAGYGNAPTPAGFGFIGPNWTPRSRWTGTYDAKWQQLRAPLLPDDFDERFFNAATPDLISPQYLLGNEPVQIIGVHPNGPLKFRLPGLSPPVVYVRLRGNRNHELLTILDTVIINTDEMKLILLWRARLRLLAGPHDVAAIKLTCMSAEVQASQHPQA